MNQTMNQVARAVVFLVSVTASAAAATEPVFTPKTPADDSHIIYGGRGVSERSAVAGFVSLIVPGIGQLINGNATPKVAVHAVLGLPVWFVAGPPGLVLGLWHVWSGWDALIDRRGGYANGVVLSPDGRAWIDASSRGFGTGAVHPWNTGPGPQPVSTAAGHPLPGTARRFSA